MLWVQRNCFTLTRSVSERKSQRVDPAVVVLVEFRHGDLHTRASVFEERQLNLLLRSWTWHPVAVGEGLQESDEGIFFLVRQFQVAELPFIDIG